MKFLLFHNFSFLLINNLYYIHAILNFQFTKLNVQYRYFLLKLNSHLDTILVFKLFCNIIRVINFNFY
jgi:hypothetical protein